MSSSRGSTRVSTLSPLSVNAMWVLAILFSLRPCQCLTDGSARHLAGHVGLVLAIAAHKAMAVCDPAEDLRGNRECKTRMAGEMTRRAIRQALARAKGK